MKEMAHRCGFTNPTRCTGQGKRSEGISRMVNSKEAIPIAESMRASRHDSVSAHLGYVEPDEEAHSKRYRAMASKTIAHEPRTGVSTLVVHAPKNKEENVVVKGSVDEKVELYSFRVTYECPLH